MTGNCARRGPGSRLALLIARVSLFSGLCVGGWLGGSSAAEAVELPDVEQPRIEITPARPDVAPPRLDDLRPVLDEVQRPEPAQPDVVEIEPPAPLDAQESESPAAIEEPVPTPAAAPTAPPPVQQPSAAPPRPAQAVLLPAEPVAVPRTHPRSPAEPRAPTEPESADEAPLDDGDHDTSPQPAPGTGGGVNDLRSALVVLPTGPSLTRPSAVSSTRPENRPVAGLASAEPSASPD
ncbi:hypothetical protein SAMN05421805_10171 [Saccharopolyspora antimicrobica]|uniref:Uncharacterized protein n=1 Tax=Saccharopolyspora antimicrobica TaxID=455193 RepID=A0A1I4QDV4_9PSEU|nr:hypothetical protein [Saccharopolyspora antimicrobica]RKT84879.1 hypothetical protein ATL45_3210 [Saccharopolyspora antimicrobica]SFM37905.1 hypothetical protein SAMN05421805_10171 [Saccharopolyspora antimicrobica]